MAEFFYKLFPNINYISTDINDEILNFQKAKYNYKNFNFYKCHAEDIDKCFEKTHYGYKRIEGELCSCRQYNTKTVFYKLSSKIKSWIYISCH